MFATKKNKKLKQETLKHICLLYITYICNIVTCNVEVYCNVKCYVYLLWL